VKLAGAVLPAAEPTAVGGVDRSAVGRLLLQAGDYVSLTKPRIVVMLLLTGYCAMVVAAGHAPPPLLTLLTLAGLALSCGGANAVNMWYDRDLDPLMERTRERPVPAGRLAAGRALAFGIACQATSLTLLWLGVGWLPALLSFGGFCYYVLVYTMWLKRRTPQNIVVGGGAGAFPPLVGWAAVTGHVGLAAVLMFLIVFLWTPPHFWSLALFRNEDYRRAGIPMMPVARGEATTKRQSLAYALLLLPTSMLLYWTGAVGELYLLAAVLLGLVFVAYAAVQLREHLPEVRWAKRTFHFSLIYLSVLFAAMVLGPHP
jgi:protoheme IX farnesyltransferase